MSFDIVVSIDMQDIINSVTAKKICNILKYGKFSYHETYLFENHMMFEVLKPKNYKSQFLKNVLDDDYAKFDMLNDIDKFDIVTLLFFFYNQVCHMLGLEYIFDSIDDMPKGNITKFDISQLKHNDTIFSLVMSGLNTY
jgi:hypothetical protein